MILPDLNLLVYAYNADAPQHREARAWWETVMNGSDAVAMPWMVCHGFIRLMTHPRVMKLPLRPAEAVEHVRSWIAQPNLHFVEPGSKHLSILELLLQALGVAGDMTTDAILAAIAIEHQCELHSNDADFTRFHGLRWMNPLAPS